MISNAEEAFQQTAQALAPAVSVALAAQEAGQRTVHAAELCAKPLQRGEHAGGLDRAEECTRARGAAAQRDQLGVERAEARDLICELRAEHLALLK